MTTARHFFSHDTLFTPRDHSRDHGEACVGGEEEGGKESRVEECAILANCAS